MKRVLIFAGSLVVLFAYWGCLDDLDGSIMAPSDTFFSFAVMNDSGADHRGVNVVSLDFGGTKPDGNTVVSNKADIPPSIDGIDGGASEWGDYESVVEFDEGTVPIGIDSATIRSRYTEDYVYFFAQWTETASDGMRVGASTTRKSYSFDGATWTRSGSEDRAVFIFPIHDSGFGTGGCLSSCHASDMSAPAGSTWDTWHWKATRNGPSKTLDDKWWDDGGGGGDGRHGDQGVSSYWEPGSSTYPTWMPGTYSSGSGTPFVGPIWAWEVVPFEPNAGWVAGDGFPGSFARIPTGSRGDVTAVGAWDGTDTWTLEIKRARSTGNRDDHQF